MIDLSGSPAPWPAAATELWADCVARAARRNELWTTPAPRGDEVLREVLATELGLVADHVTIVASLRAAALTYARRFRHVVVERPTYPGLLPVLRGSGARVSLALWPEILSGSTEGSPETTVVWLTSPGRNPDGATLSSADHERIDALAARGYRVVVNETYAWFADGRAPRGADRAGSLHKLRGVGARIGWVAGPSYFDEAFPELLGTPPSPVWQRAWGLFLRGEGLALLRATVLADTAAAKRAFADRLASSHRLHLAAFDGPSTLIPLAEESGDRAAIPDEAIEAEASATLERAGFRVVAARDFHADGPALRVTFLGVSTADAERFADELAHGVRTALPPRRETETREQVTR